MLLDWQRKHNWQEVFWRKTLLCSLLSATLGVMIEYAQANMGLGRGFEYPDMVADTIGALTVGAAWLFLQRIWTNT